MPASSSPSPFVFLAADTTRLAIVLALAALAVLLQPASALPRVVCAVCPEPASPVLPALLAAFGRAARPDAASDEVRTLVIVLLQERCGVSARHTLVDSPAPGPTLPHSDFDILLDTVALTLSRMLVDADASVSLNLGATPP